MHANALMHSERGDASPPKTNCVHRKTKTHKRQGIAFICAVNNQHAFEMRTRKPSELNANNVCMWVGYGGGLGVGRRKGGWWPNVSFMKYIQRV